MDAGPSLRRVSLEIVGGALSDEGEVVMFGGWELSGGGGDERACRDGEEEA